MHLVKFPRSPSSSFASISCSGSFVPCIEQLSDARLIYSVAPSMGHNQVLFRGSEVIELQHFEPASVDDIASVHAIAYVSGFEKVMDQAVEKGLIFLDDSGPTYATATTFQESIVAASAGLALVDSVVISQPGMSISW